jgi:hypothetical protein
MKRRSEGIALPFYEVLCGKYNNKTDINDVVVGSVHGQNSVGPI